MSTSVLLSSRQVSMLKCSLSFEPRCYAVCVSQCAVDMSLLATMLLMRWLPVYVVSYCNSELLIFIDVLVRNRLPTRLTCVY